MARPTNLPVDPARIAEVIDGLAQLTDPGRPYTRRAFTALFPAGRDFLLEKFRAAGLETRIDAAGNLIGRRAGRKPGSGTIMLGSHSDTVPDGGRYDGIAGVAVALEVARALADKGIALDHDLRLSISLPRRCRSSASPASAAAAWPACCLRTGFPARATG